MDTKHHKNYDLPFDVGKTFLLFILFLMSSSAFAGRQTVVLPENPCSIGIIVSAIKDQTGMSVDFNQGVLNLEKKVRMKSKRERVTTLMDELSAKENVEYEIAGRHIIVTSRAKTVKEAGSAQQDNVTVRGTVTDKNGDPLIGASVKVKGQNIATVTDIDGKYSLTVVRGSVLVCTYVGFVTTEQTANGNRSVDFVLDEQNRSLNELVVIGYGSQKKQSLTGAISAISSDDIVTTKNENVQNMLTGKIPGVRVVQNTAEPGEFNNSFDIRGMGSPLIIIDGIPRENMTRIDPQDIERISVLKDASAAIYGVRAANGVVLITTKRGREGHLSLEYNGNYGLQFPSGSPESALAADAMTILNEKKMHNVNGGSLRFTDEEIASYRNGTNPSTDWYHEIMKSGMPQTQHNISLSGGNEKINFYTSLGYDNQQSFIRSGDIYYEKFNMRSNITAKPFDNLTVETSMSGIMEDNHKSNYDTHWIIRCMQRSPSYFPIYANNNPDYLFDTRVDDNPYAQSHSKYVGTRRYKTTWIQTSASVKYDIPGIEGLSLKALINYDYQINNNKTYWNQFYTYSYDANTDTYNGTSHNGPNRVRRQAYFRKSWIYQLSADYRHTFAKAHNVGALFLIEGRDRQGDNFYAQRNLSMAMPHLFAGHYTVLPYGPFVPLTETDENGVYTKDERLKDFRISGKVAHNFEVEPFLNVSIVGQPTVKDNKISVNVHVERGTSNPNYQQDCTDVVLFVNNSSTYVGNNNYDSRVSTFIGGDAAKNAVGHDITITSEDVTKANGAGQNYYVRVGARINYATNGVRRYNYSEPLVVAVP